MNSNIKSIGFLVGGLALGVLFTTGFFMSKEKKKAVDVSAALGVSLVKVDGQVYTTESLPGDSTMEYYMLENNIFNAKETFSNQLGLRVALAKDANKTVNATTLPKLAELLPIQPVTDFEAKQYYDKIISQMGNSVFAGQTFEQIKPQLEARMNQQKSSEILNKKIEELQQKGRLKFLLTKPIPPSVELNVSAYPARGNLTSTVTFVEVADYLCPHCRESEPIIEGIFKEYHDKIKFVHVSYPLSPNGLSGALARGAFCANKQGSAAFWKYHALAFQVPWGKNDAPSGQEPFAYYNAVTSDVAQNAELNMTLFNACLTSQAASNYIKNAQSEFNESKGFQGTPTFYLNNKIIQATPEQLSSTLKAALAK